MNIYEQVTERILEQFRRGVVSWRKSWTAGQPKSLNARNVPLPEVIEHARRIVDYLWRSELADDQFSASLATNTPHVYDSVVVLERWITEQTARLMAPRESAEGRFFGLRFEHPIFFAFAAGFLAAVVFFLPEILGV